MTVTLTITAADNAQSTIVLPAPNVSGTASSDAYSSVDGSAGAPAGTPQHPTLLNAYVASGVTAQRFLGTAGPPNFAPLNSSSFQPPWKVAGVDYAVGPDSSVTLIKAVGGSTPLPTGWAWASATHVASQQNNPAPLNGFDFTGINNFFLQITNNNCTVSNCKLAMLSGTQASPMQHLIDFGGTGGLITKCDINAANFIADKAATMDLMTGSGTITYCWIRNAYSQHIEDGGGGVWTIKYNLLENAGTFVGAHGDYYEGPSAQGASGSLIGWVVDFNTMYQAVAATTQGFAFEPGNTSTVEVDCSYNTALSPGATMNIFTGVGAPGNYTVNSTWTNNYVDMTNFESFIRSASVPGVHLTNNINMKTGALAIANQ